MFSLHGGNSRASRRGECRQPRQKPGTGVRRREPGASEAGVGGGRRRRASAAAILRQSGCPAGASAEISVTTDATWTATPAGEGFTVEPISGTGNASLYVSATEANDNTDDGTAMTFTLLMPTLNTRYRLTVLNGKNAQPARLVLTYVIPQL